MAVMRSAIVMLVLIIILCGTFQSPAVLAPLYKDLQIAQQAVDQGTSDLNSAKKQEQQAVTDRDVRAGGGGGEGAKQQDLDRLTGEAKQAQLEQAAAQAQLILAQPKLDDATENLRSASRIIRLYALGCFGASGAMAARLWLRKQQSLIKGIDFFRNLAGIFAGGFAAIFVYSAVQTGVWGIISRPTETAPGVDDLYTVMVAIGSGFVADIVFSAVRLFARSAKGSTG
jgi:hypothetical protein